MRTASGRRRFVPFVRRLVGAVPLALLCVVNVLPPVLVIRQAFSPEAETARWPLPILPHRLTLENFAELVRTQSLLEHVLLSLWVAFATAFLSIALGFPAGWAAARWRRLAVLETRFAAASRVVPPIAIAVPLTALLIPLGLYNHPLGLGLILAHLLMGVPFAMLLSYAAFCALPRELEEAAYIDGCSALGAFVRIAMPAVRGSIAAAFVLIFLLSWDEFTFAILIQLTHRTMPPLIYYYTEFGQLGAASVLAVTMLLPAVCVIFVLQRFVARGVQMWVE